jgi:putative sigma-54 modulation protein
MGTYLRLCLPGGAVSVEINISMRHGHLSDTTRAKITSKVERLSRIFDRLTSIGVKVDLKNPDAPRVDMNVSAEHKHDFVATEQSSTLMASVDGAIHKLEQQLRKYKERIQERHRNPGSRRQGASPDSESESA